MAKVFISYKYADDSVRQDLHPMYWAENITGATARGYVNWMQELIGEDNINKGEYDGEDIGDKSDEQIWEYLKPRIHDSTVTIVVISKGMKDPTTIEGQQWIPQEIRYSLREGDRGERTSLTNGLLGVVLPDENGSYEYIWTNESTCDDCGHTRTLNKYSPLLFNIISQNIFNHKAGGEDCCSASCGNVIYSGEHSYLPLVTFDNFKEDGAADKYIENALNIKERKEEYEVHKSI